MEYILYFILILYFKHSRMSSTKTIDSCFSQCHLLALWYT